MAYVIYTDEAYKRDFYHYVLKAHFEGYGIVVEKGFEWKKEEGTVSFIRIKYPINPYWYELGNRPDYLSSRTIYWYRARLTYWLEGPEITIYGEWVQFTSINPMCTGFTNFEAKRIMRTYYSYHGIIMKCTKRPEPEPFVCEPEEPPGPKWILVNCWYPVGIQFWRLIYNVNWFPPSSDDDVCAYKFPDGKVRYYFIDILLKNIHPSDYYSFSVSTGSICDYTKYSGYAKEIHVSVSDQVWARYNYLVFLTYKGAGTKVCVWRSETGEKPSYDPTE